ncbi:MAG TPA: hypothetical protein VFE36_11745 [Candidatus Baltobacteraceae bacterium]|nr:hypothetical protein [Candidatus Baltobacteraceae bacterium]
MKIGIIGSDDRAAAIGRLLSEGGHEVSFDNPYQLASTMEILIFSVPHDELDSAITAVGTVVTPQAIVEAGDSRPAGDDTTDAECLAKKLNSHAVVRALIVLPQAGANIPICGDDPLAKALVEQAFAASNCVVTDRGPLANAAELYPPPHASEQGTIEAPRPSSTPTR